MKPSFTKILSAGCALLLQAEAFAQEYHVNNLTPAGYGWSRLSAIAAGKQAGTAGLADRNREHSILLSGTGLNVRDLTPLDTGFFTISSVSSLDAIQQAGGSYMSGTYQFPRLHAMVWNGSYLNPVDLTPNSDTPSYCFGVHNGEQVGHLGNHAYSWHGTPASAVDLHVSGWPVSVALGCHDGEEVGFVSLFPNAMFESLANLSSHAVRWSGTAASAVDIHPDGLDSSEALCTTGTQQGGWGYSSLRADSVHALVWSGDAASAVDFHPAGFSNSRITGMAGGYQVGDGWVGPAGAAGSVRHALVWSGTPESAIDLNQFLPGGYTNAVATGVDTNGNIVGYAYNTGVVDSIAVMFVPGPAAPAHLSGITLAESDVAPGTDFHGAVTLDGPAPSGGVPIRFQATHTELISDQIGDATFLVNAGGVVVVPEGETTAVFALSTTTNFPWQVPVSLELHANDGAVTRSTPALLSPVVDLAALYGDTNVEGGFNAFIRVTLRANVRAAEGAVVHLSSSDPALINVPESFTVPFGTVTGGIGATTAVVTAPTPVTITATCNGSTRTAVFVLNPPQVITVSSVSVANCVGGKNTTGTVTMNYPVRLAGGAVVVLTSNDSSLRVPVNVTVPFGARTASFIATSSTVKSLKTVTVTATHDGATVSTTVNVNPVPSVSILSADWDPSTLLLKVQATTSYQPSVLTFGTDSSGGALGTMSLGATYWSGSAIVATAPKTAIVWNSNGGQSSLPVTIKGTSGGGGGGGGTATAYKLSISTNGKGTVTVSPAASSYAAGSVVTLTATPAAGQPWIGWSGAITGTNNPATVTINANTSVTANFR